MIFSAVSIYSQNLLVNGDFESGGNGVGFSLNGAGYNLITAPFSGTTSPGDYAFTTNPQPMNTSNFISGGDHTSGTGNMLVIDGNTTGGSQRFWRAGSSGGGVCGLTIGVTYTFSYWVKSVSSNVIDASTSADIRAQVGNVSNLILIPPSAWAAPLPAAGWKQVVYTFQPVATCVTIELFNNNTNLVGNDFAVDDFSVTPPVCATPTASVTVQPTCPVPTGTIVFTSPINVTPFPVPSDLFISEVTDEDVGALTYIEIFNGTGVTKNLANYRLKVYNNGNAGPSCDFLLSGVLANNSVYVISVGSATNLGGVTPDLSVPACGGVNTDDNIRLTTSANVEIDLWGRTDGVSFTPANQPGFTYRRSQAAPHPSLTWNAANWTTIDPQDYTDVGNYTYPTAIYQYSVDGVTYQASPTFAGLVPNVYNVRVKDIVSGCISTPFPLTVNPVPTIAAPTASATVQTTCSPSTGTIVVSAPTGANLEYSINGVAYQSSTTFSGLTPNTYNVTVRNTSSGCVSTATSVTINPYSAPPAAPVVSTPVYYCQSSASPAALTATASTGATLNWYGTNATGGTPSSTATVPAVSTVGSVPYYVSQTIGGCESPRAAIDVRVVADTGQVIMNFRCDPTQVTAPNTVYFDWSNFTGFNGWYYTYTIQGGPTVSGVTGPSSFEVGLSPGPYLSPGQSVTFTITQAYGLPCVPPQSRTCNAPCAVSTTPIFASIPGSICSGSTAPTLATTSDNGISGIWSPTTVSNTTGGSYVFTPNSTLFPCAVTVTKGITVTASPNAGTLSGNDICVGSSTTFSSTTSGGAWASSDNTVATINSSTGLVNGIAAGGATMTYTVTGTGGCTSASDFKQKNITVTAPPNAGTLSGTPNVCAGQTTALSSTVSGGTWSSMTPAVATIDAVGVVTGVSGGSSIIKYTVTGTGGCGNAEPQLTFTVYPKPSAGTLSGNQNVCVGGTTTFASAVSGGTWSSSDPSVASVNSSTGVITGISSAPANTAIIKYSVVGTGGCTNFTTLNVTSYSPPNAGTISGNQSICEGATTSFSATVSGGTWSSSTPVVATINSSGLVTGVSGGTSIIGYTLAGPGGCSSAAPPLTLTVNPKPSPGTLNGNQNVCVGGTTTFGSTVAGGTWGSSDPTIASVNSSTGVITGISSAAGNTATITYSVIGVGGCTNSATRSVTTNLPPNAGTLSGNQVICEGSTTLFLSTMSGGTWVSSNTTVATVNSTTGQILGVSGGNSTITYTVPGSAGCTSLASAIRPVTVNAKTVPDFSQIAAFCTGTTPPTLPLISPNGVNGTWAPPIIDNTATNDYVFRPDANECATTQTLHVEIIQLTMPDFPDLEFCYGAPAHTLNTTSPNGYTGTWSPSIVDEANSAPYVFTPDPNQCADIQSINVTVNYPTLNSIDGIVTSAFSDNQVITVIASAAGNYLYQLDFGPLQTSNVFENVTSGMHTIKVIDVNGCSSPVSLTRDDILVINYPTFFTPNGDGFNDNWNIFDLTNDPNTAIFIFDRYGKLLKQISPFGLGWDGTYNGAAMPASDYWFTIDYTEQNVSKTFKSHFSLKR